MLKMLLALAPLAITVQVRADAPNVQYQGPLEITKGGTYTGNFESMSSDLPAINIKTSEPVIVENAIIRSKGRLINAQWTGGNVTIRNVQGYGLTPTRTDFSMGRFVNAENFKNIVIENCYMEQTSGVYLAAYKGNHTPSESIRFVRNKAKNIDGRKPNGGKDFAQLIQFNNVLAARGVEIAWNEVINEPGKSFVEDNINIFMSNGTSDSPIRIHDNYIFGAYHPYPDTHSDYTGGGIMAGDGSTSDPAKASGFIKVYNNIVVNTTHYGVSSANGHDVELYGNRIIHSGLRHDTGAYILASNVGLWMNNETGDPAVGYNKSAHDNVIGYTKRGNYKDRNDQWLPLNGSDYSRNIELSKDSPITIEMEKAEYKRWTDKLAANNVQIGVISTVPSAPAPAPTTPAASCAGTGSLTFEKWENVGGESVSQIPLSQAPTKTSTVSIAEINNLGDSYGSRLSGYVCAPYTGDYVFHISGDDNAELHLGNSETSEPAIIASVPGWTEYRIRNKYAEQKSVSIRLEAGKKYSVRVLQKEGGGGDHVSIGWTLPNGALEFPLPASRIAPKVALAPAPAPAPSSTTTIVASHSNRCIGIDGGSTANFAQAIQWDCNGNADQQFTLRPVSGGRFQLVMKHSGKCLDVAGVSQSDGAMIHQIDCIGESQPNQLFFVKSAGNGLYDIVASHSNKCLDVWGAAPSNGGKITQYACHGGANQRFKLSLPSTTTAPAPAPVNATVKVKVSGNSAAGVKAHFKVYANSTLIGEGSAEAQQEFTFSAPASLKPITRVMVQFDNDAYINGQDRNLYVSQVSLDGKIKTPDAAGVSYDIDALDGVNVKPGSSVMPWNGYMIYPMP